MKTNTVLLLVIIVLLVGIGVLLLNRLPPAPVKAVSADAGREECLRTQKLLRNAIAQYALENNLSDDTLLSQRPDFHDFKCPSGGCYILITVGIPPRCSITEHEFHSEH